MQLAVSLCVLSVSLPLSVPVSAPATIPQDIELKQQYHWDNSEANFTSRYVTQAQGPRLLPTDRYLQGSPAHSRRSRTELQP